MGCREKLRGQIFKLILVCYSECHVIRLLLRLLAEFGQFLQKMAKMAKNNLKKSYFENRLLYRLGS